MYYLSHRYCVCNCENCVHLKDNNSEIVKDSFDPVNYGVATVLYPVTLSHH